ncbi:caspase family protein [Terasakiella sp. SH-1]|uniref:caspase family protein n=1 Tax=Terasakiella sp. SH-1 TaxID=2560057 RepID=UPI0010745B64|nr:caspase family protein [Terasakiella sp. SH-1]
MKTLHLLLTGSLLWTGITLPAQGTEPQNDDVAIIIGNKSYVDQDIPEVSFAHNDATAMQHFARTVLKIREENIIFLKDATQAKMQTAFGRRGNHRGKAFQYVKPQVSNLYVFYSGHGLPGLHDNQNYLLPVDAEIETAEINGYPIDTLYENLSKVGARSVTVFLDACFSGNSHGGSLISRASGATILPKKKTSDIDQKETLTVITAASKDQLASWDEESQHGLFTEYLLRALYGEADQDKDGQVKLAEVSRFLSEDMRYKARRTYNRDQMPTIQGNREQVLVAAVNGIYPKRPAKIESDEEDIDVVEPPVIDTSEFKLYPVEQNMFALKNANIRRLPTVRSKRVMTLPKGEPIHVAAKIIDQPWYAVERGDGIIGYVFADLLGEEKEIATEEENRSIRELKARLEKLEKQTRLSAKDILPAPKPQTEKQNQIVERRPLEEENLDDDWGTTVSPYMQIKTTLKSMGALLAKQSFIQHYKLGQSTKFNYNWIRVDVDHCRITASISLQHNAQFARDFNIHDHQVQAGFWQKLPRKKRAFRIRNIGGKITSKLEIFQYGPFVFKEKQARRRFIAKAERLHTLCQIPDQAVIDDTVRNQPFVKTDRQSFKRPPPPPFRRPPPPRR